MMFIVAEVLSFTLESLFSIFQKFCSRLKKADLFLSLQRNYFVILIRFHSYMSRNEDLECEA